MPLGISIDDFLNQHDPPTLTAQLDQVTTAQRSHRNPFSASRSGWQARRPPHGRHAATGTVIPAWGTILWR